MSKTAVGSGDFFRKGATIVGAVGAAIVIGKALTGKKVKPAELLAACLTLASLL